MYIIHWKCGHLLHLPGKKKGLPLHLRHPAVPAPCLLLTTLTSGSFSECLLGTGLEYLGRTEHIHEELQRGESLQDSVRINLSPAHCAGDLHQACDEGADHAEDGKDDNTDNYDDDANNHNDDADNYDDDADDGDELWRALLQ